MSEATVIVTNSAKASFDRDETFGRYLDAVERQFRSGSSIYQAMTDLFEFTGFIVENDGSPEYVDHLRGKVAAHPVSHFINQCPFTRHSVEKPRGYAGDAALIDYIYGHDDVGDVMRSASTVGRQIARHNLDSPAAAAVRTRRHIIAGMLGDLARERSGARVLSVACGHARELDLMDEAALSRLGTLIGFDQDERSLAVAGSYRVGNGRLTPHQGTIIDLLKNRTLDGFHLIYAAGLFDYLSDRLCRRLTASLFSRLAPGGRLLVANFLPGVRDRGYMEVFMHWSLIYRDRALIMDFLSDIDATDIAKTTYFVEPNRNVGFLDIRRHE